MNEEKYQLALKWYTQGVIDADGDIGDGISGDFYDQYGDQFPDESETPREEWISVEDKLPEDNEQERLWDELSKTWEGLTDHDMTKRNYSFGILKSKYYIKKINK